MSSDRLLLDTHAWPWLAFCAIDRFHAGTLAAIDRASASDRLLVSIVSVWELALLEARQRLRLPMTVDEWVERALERPDIRLIGLDQPRTVIDSCRLPGVFHADPADRLLVATARSANAVLVTRDRKLLDYTAEGHVRVLAA